MEKQDTNCKCKGWKKNIGKINSAFSMQWIHGGGGYSGEPWLYCPWCAKKLPTLKKVKDPTDK